MKISNFSNFIFIGVSESFICGISSSLIILLFILFPLCFIYVYYTINFNFFFYNLMLVVLFFLLIVTFHVENLFRFYVFFESILVPMLFIIGVWGSRGRKIHAAFFFFYFTFASSLFLVIGIFSIFFEFGSLGFFDFQFSPGLSSKNQIFALNYTNFFCFCFLLGFAAKIPSFPVYIWLPEAHVEAPTVGSVILAGVLLKLGYYGLLKTVFFTFDPFNFLNLKPFFKIIFLLSLVYGSISAICQVDLKKIVAYSSIVHMNFAMLGFLNDFEGIAGTSFLMISHGLISSALFFLVGFLYDRFGTRNLLYFGGLTQYMPIFSVFFLVFIFGNMSLPGTSNFVGEILVFFSLFNKSFSVIIFLVISVLLTSVFCLILLNCVIFYQFKQFLEFNLKDLYLFEYCILVYLGFYVFLFGLFPNPLLCMFYGSLF